MQLEKYATEKSGRTYSQEMESQREEQKVKVDNLRMKVIEISDNIIMKHQIRPKNGGSLDKYLPSVGR